MSSSKQEAKVVYVSPQIAERMLKQDAEIRAISGKKNRKIDKSTLEKLCNDMENDRWILTGSAIQFDSDGHLIDGQHRLQAVIKTGKTCAMFVVTGLNEEAFSVLDQAKRRTISDMLYINDVPYYSFVGSIAIKILNWKKGRTLDRNNARVTTKEALNFATEHDAQLRQSAYNVVGMYRPIPGLKLGLIMALHYLFAEKNKLQADHFIEKLITGKDCLTEVEKMIFKLRDLLIRDARAKRRMGTEDYAQYIIRAWNAYREGRPLRTFTGPSRVTEIV